MKTARCRRGLGMSLTPRRAPPTGLLPDLGCFNIGRFDLPPYNYRSSGRASCWSSCWVKGADSQVSSPSIQSVIHPQNPDLINFERDRTCSHFRYSASGLSGVWPALAGVRGENLLPPLAGAHCEHLKGEPQIRTNWQS